MSDPAPPPGFTEDVSHTLPDAPAATPVDSNRTEFFRSTLEHMLNSGATRADLDAFAQQQNVDPKELSGFTPEIFAMVKSGKRVPVGLHGAAQASAPPAGFTEEVPLPTAEPKERSTMDTINMGLADVQRGLNAPLDMLAAVPNALINAVTGAGMSTSPLNDQVDQQVAAYEAQGHDLTPHSDGEKLISAGIKGAAPALVLGPAGMAPMAVEAGAGGLSSMASEGARQAGASPLLQLGAGLLGGIGGAGAVAGGAKALGAFGAREATPLMQAFDRQQVPALAADVGGTASRMGSGAANMTLGGIPLSQAAERSVLAAREAKTRIADNIGTAARDISGKSDSLGAGLAAQKGARAFITDSGIKADGLYKAIPIAPDRMARATNTRHALSELGEGFTSNPELSKLWADNPRMRATLEALTPETTPIYNNAIPASAGQPAIGTAFKGGQISWNDLQHFRTIVGRIVGQPGLSSDGAQIDQLRKLYGALSEDMRATAQSAGPKALSSFERANTYFRARQDRIDNVLGDLLGKDLNASGSDAFRSIERWSAEKGDAFKLARALRSMPEDEANTVRATIFDRLGNVSKGRQDGDGLVFSPNDFVTHWNGLSSRAKSVLFPGDEYKQSIDDLVRIASAQKGAQQFANVSRTGNAVNGIALATGFFTNPLGTLPVAIGQVGFGRLMASPRFARWLASAPSKPNAAAQLAHVNRLAAIAASQPAIANDVLNLQERLAQAFAQSPGSLAAEQNKPDSRREPPANNNADQQFHGVAQ